MKKDRLEILISKFYDKTLTSEEKIEFENLLKSSLEARETFHNWNFVNQAINTFVLNDELDTPYLNPKKISLSHIWHKVANIAAILTIPLLLTLAYVVYKDKKDFSVTYSEVSCVNGKVVSITLPDSSKVQLYSGSTLRYPNHFTDNKRSVELKGEATFEVKSDTHNPFYVKMPDSMYVKAYGTKFLISNYNEESITVYLERGKVDFEEQSLPSPIKMTPNTQLVFDKKTKKYTINDSSPQEHDAYEKGILLFSNRPLSEIVQKIERLYGVDIEIRSESLKNFRFTATFEDESVEHILNMLKISSPKLEWKKENNKYIITKK